MSNKPVPVRTEVVSAPQEATNVSVTGRVENFYNQPGNVQNTVTVIIPVAQGDGKPHVPTTFEKRCFNLFVIDGEQFDLFRSGSIMLNDDLALTKCIDEAIKKEHCRLDAEAVKKIKSYLSIFACTNAQTGLPGDAQNVAIGAVQSIKRTDAGVRIDYVAWKNILQTTILGMKERLGIRAAEYRNEFDDTHWTIKEVNLIDVLQGAGIDAFNIM